MKRGPPSLRLRLRRIETKPKPVHAMRFQDFAGIGKRPDLQDELLDIIESIERGSGVPERHYRAGIDRDRDGLLEERGILHLHLGGKHSDVLVFLVQYAERVVLLETNTHVHFRTQPAGKNILGLSQSWFADLERELADAQAAAAAAAHEGERRAAADRSTLLAASIAAFKAKAGLD